MTSKDVFECSMCHSFTSSLATRELNNDVRIMYAHAASQGMPSEMLPCAECKVVPHPCADELLLSEVLVENTLKDTQDVVEDPHTETVDESDSSSTIPSMVAMQMRQPCEAFAGVAQRLGGQNKRSNSDTSEEPPKAKAKEAVAPAPVVAPPAPPVLGSAYP